MTCPKCGKKMLDDRGGITGARWFCAANHGAVVMYENQQGENHVIGRCIKEIALETAEMCARAEGYDDLTHSRWSAPDGWNEALVEKWEKKIGELAAKALHDQSLGFTYEDVNWLRGYAASHEGITTEARVFASIANRIATLLPPDSETTP